MDRLIASDLSYFVAQKQRRESDGALLTPQQPTQRAYPRAVCTDFLPCEDGADHANSNPASVAVGEREGQR